MDGMHFGILRKSLYLYERRKQINTEVKSLHFFPSLEFERKSLLGKPFSNLRPPLLLDLFKLHNKPRTKFNS